MKYTQGKSLVNVVAVDSRCAEVMKEIASGAVPSDAVVIYKGRNCVYKINRGGQWLCVKAFRSPGMINSLIYTRFRDSKAKRSFDFARRLLSMGIGTPAPIGYAEVKSSGRLRGSYYVSQLLDADNLRQWEDKPDADGLVDAFAAEMVKIHRCGVLHKDFSPGNVLYTKDLDGRYRFYLIDLNRMEFGVRSHSRLMRNFRAINL
ncbi:MAG: lipopolysaccharide kinase InaA family protein, partial [Muribaculaceae bacterium]|nr:lipopolysaccharide kinase InaA family protein [Muribaculaceae bacterium]